MNVSSLNPETGRFCLFFPAQALLFLSSVHLFFRARPFFLCVPVSLLCLPSVFPEGWVAFVSSQIAPVRAHLYRAYLARTSFFPESTYLSLNLSILQAGKQIYICYFERESFLGCLGAITKRGDTFRLYLSLYQWGERLGALCIYLHLPIRLYQHYFIDPTVITHIDRSREASSVPKNKDYKKHTPFWQEETILSTTSLPS